MPVHAGAVVPEQRPGHERGRLPHFFATFFTKYLYLETLSAIFVSVSKRMSISVWPPVATSWWWTSTGTPTDQRQHHVRPNVLELVHRRHREVALLVADLVAEVRLSAGPSLPLFQAPATESMK